VSLVLDWHEAQLAELLNDPAGPVGQYIAELSERAAAVARATVPVRDPVTRNRHRRAGRNSNARPPGFTKAGIRVHGPVIGSRGGMYGGVNAPADPAIFLEYPARQMARGYPFLTTGLDSLGLLWPAACWVTPSSPSTRRPATSGSWLTRSSARR
jgi:hypothetical protein